MKTIIMKLTICIVTPLVLFSFTANYSNYFSEQDSGISKDQSERIEFVYLGERYSSSYKQKNNSEIILDNPEINSLYQKLNKLPNLATYVDTDGVVRYYDNLESLKSDLQRKKFAIFDISEKGKSDRLYQSQASCNISLRNSTGSEGLYFTCGTEGLHIPGLSVYNFNDKLSDIIVTSESNIGIGRGEASAFFLLTLYRDEDYRGRSISFLIPDQRRINLLHYEMSSGTASWANHTTSLKLEYIGPTPRSSSGGGIPGGR